MNLNQSDRPKGNAFFSSSKDTLKKFEQRKSNKNVIKVTEETREIHYSADIFLLSVVSNRGPVKLS